MFRVCALAMVSWMFLSGTCLSNEPIVSIEAKQLQSFLDYKNTKVWFVKNDHVGPSNGTHNAPFSTLLEAEHVSQPGDVIYLFAGDGTTKGLDHGICLKSGQRLLGSGRHHVVMTERGTVRLLNSGKDFPKITNIAGKPGVTLANGCEVAGIHVTKIAGGDGIFGCDILPTTPHFYGITNAHIHHNIIDECAVLKGAICLYNCQGHLIITDNVIKNILGRASGHGIDICDAIIPINTDIQVARNTISNCSDNGICVTHNAPGGQMTCLIEDNQLMSCLDGAGLFFGSKKMVSLGAMLGVLQRNTIEKCRSGIEMNTCGSSFLGADVNNNYLRENLHGNLIARTFHKSSMHVRLSDNDGDQSYFFKQDSSESHINLEIGSPNLGEIVR
jgi:hypothetical protein